MKYIILPENIFKNLDVHKRELVNKYGLDVNVEGYGFFLEKSGYANNLIAFGNKEVILHGG